MCWSRMTAKANGPLEKVYGMPPFILHSISLGKISKKLVTAITSGEETGEHEFRGEIRTYLLKNSTGFPFFKTSFSMINPLNYPYGQEG